MQHVLYVLSTHADHDGTGAYPELGRLAAETGRPATTVRRALDVALQAGWITHTSDATARTGTVGLPDGYNLTAPAETSR